MKKLIIILIALFSAVVGELNNNEIDQYEDDSSIFSSINEKEGLHGPYYFGKGQLKFRIQELEREMQAQNAIIRNLETKVASYEESIRNKDFQLEQYKNETIIKSNMLAAKDEEQIQAQKIIVKNLEVETAALKTKVAIYEESLRNKDVQLEKYRTESEFKDNIIATFEKLLPEVKKITALQSQIEQTISDYERKEGSCIGKSIDIHAIKVPGMDPFSVPCDSDWVDSGWTVIQRRLDGSVNFNRNWTEYRNGFGDLRGEFFIGLEKIHLITKSQPHELYIFLDNRFARYSEFLIGNEEEQYELKKTGEYSGDAGNSLIDKDYENLKFSTPDRDNDKSVHFNCASNFKAGWWYSNCYYSNLNGLYTPEEGGVDWIGLSNDSLRYVQMMIKPKLT